MLPKNAASRPPSSRKQAHVRAVLTVPQEAVSKPLCMTRLHRWSAWRIAPCLALLAVVRPALALNLPVASRVIAFVQPPLSGLINAAIIFDPGNPASEAEAVSIERQVGDGLVIGRGVIRVHRVPIAALGQPGAIHLAFVTAGIRDQQQLAAFAARQGVLTITSDASCVLAARCVLAVSDATHTQITVSRDAAKASRVQFTSAFLMLVKER